MAVSNACRHFDLARPLVQQQGCCRNQHQLFSRDDGQQDELGAAVITNKPRRNGRVSKVPWLSRRYTRVCACILCSLNHISLSAAQLHRFRQCFNRVRLRTGSSTGVTLRYLPPRSDVSPLHTPCGGPSVRQGAIRRKRHLLHYSSASGTTLLAKGAARRAYCHTPRARVNVQESSRVRGDTGAVLEGVNNANAARTRCPASELTEPD